MPLASKSLGYMEMDVKPGMVLISLKTVTPDGGTVFNEINTIPGFTSISMYPKLFEASGIPYSELIDDLIALALEA